MTKSSVLWAVLLLGAAGAAWFAWGRGGSSPPGPPPDDDAPASRPGSNGAGPNEQRPDATPKAPFAERYGPRPPPPANGFPARFVEARLSLGRPGAETPEKGAALVDALSKLPAFVLRWESAEVRDRFLTATVLLPPQDPERPAAPGFPALPAGVPLAITIPAMDQAGYEGVITEEGMWIGQRRREEPPK
jgi:hypothetical protein